MAEVNIGGDPNDRSYRYKRPKCQTKIEGRGNGIKTVIPNMVDVAKALNITPSYPTKFFGIELGAQSKYDKKREVAVVNGAHDTSVIETIMEKFIETYVLCPSPACRLPEIRLKVKKDQIRTDCAACGTQATVGDSHKLTVYIVKNPPTKSKKPKDGVDAKALKKEKRNKKGKDDENVENELKDENDAGVVEKKPKEAVAEVWYTDTSAEAAEARKQEEMAAMGDDGASPTDINQMLESVHIAQTVAANAPAEDILRAFVRQQDRSDSEIISELRRLELSRGLNASAKLNALVAGLVNIAEPRTVPSQFKKYASLLKSFTKTRSESQMLLSAVEHLICNVEPTMLVPRTALILQALYDSDILSEDDLIDWYDSSTSLAGVSDFEREEIREKAKVFIDWLKETDESDEDEE